MRPLPTPFSNNILSLSIVSVYNTLLPRHSSAATTLLDALFELAEGVLGVNTLEMEGVAHRLEYI